MLPDHAATADFQCRFLAIIARMLRRQPKRRKGVDLAVRTKRRPPLNNNMRAQMNPVTNHGMRADNAIGANLYIGAYVCARVDDGCRMNGNGHNAVFRAVSAQRWGSTIIAANSASEVFTPSTVA